MQLQQTLDEKLWSFDPTSFIAHGVDQVDAAVCISAKQPSEQGWLVFNFNNHALEQVNHFSHIIEIVENNEAAKQIGREKFKMYRRLGIEPRTFKL
ncbi:DNA polymerase III subunit chi [Acinetobacter baumannii]|nr:DNA polymerase III subunit chi [Acinetobacter baumannii]